MKKILLGTTAVIALGTMTTEAFAADKIALGLGGFMKHYVGIGKNDEVASTSSAAERGKDIGQKSNTEVYFTGSTTLDNGIKVAARIEMEADGAATNNIDRSYLTVSSDAMGSVVVGHAPHYSNSSAVRVPQVTGLDWGDTDGWGGTATSSTTTTTTFANATGTGSRVMDTLGGDSVKLKYTSPSFSGFSVGASYSAAEAGNASEARLVVAAQDGYSYGASYSGEMSGVGISASLSHSDVDTDYSFNYAGLNLSMAGFTVGGGYRDFEDTRSGTLLTTDERQDGNAWELGVAYKTGPYSVAAGYLSAKRSGQSGIAGDDKDTKWSVAAAYDLGASVALTANYYNAKANLEGTGTEANKARTISGVIAGIEVGF